MKKLPISLFITIEEKSEDLERTLQSTPFVSEIFVLDSTGQARVPQVASQFAARVVGSSPTMLLEAVENATKEAQNEVILWLKSGEVVSGELSDDISVLFLERQADYLGGFRIPIQTQYLGRWIQHSGWYPNRSLRLFNRKKCHWEKAEKGLQIATESKVRSLPTPIYTTGHQGISEHLHELEIYSTKEAQKLKASGKKFSAKKAVIKPIAKFLNVYFARMGFRDGLQGFYISVFSALGVFLTLAKLWGLENQEKMIETASSGVKEEVPKALDSANEKHIHNTNLQNQKEMR